MKDFKIRLLSLALLISYFCIGYFSINAFNVWRDFSFSVALPFEGSIPFYSWTILGYNLVFLSLLGVVFLLPNESFKKGAWAFFWLMTIHYVIFLAFPVEMTMRPHVEPDGFFSGVTWFYFQIDKTYNCFPSLHVAFPTLSALLLWPQKKWRPIFSTFALLTAIAVVLVKQHYIADAIAGALVAYGVYKFFKKNVEGSGGK